MPVPGAPPSRQPLRMDTLTYTPHPLIFFLHAHTYLSHPPLGKPSKWSWLYPPSTPHFTRAAHLPHHSTLLMSHFLF